MNPETRETQRVKVFGGRDFGTRPYCTVCHVSYTSAGEVSARAFTALHPHDRGLRSATHRLLRDGVCSGGRLVAWRWRTRALLPRTALDCRHGSRPPDPLSLGSAEHTDPAWLWKIGNHETNQSRMTAAAPCTHHNTCRARTRVSALHAQPARDRSEVSPACRRRYWSEVVMMRCSA